MIDVARDGRVAELRFGRGDGRNALSVALLKELLETVRRLDEDEDLSVVILVADGANFSVGFDLACPEMAKIFREAAGAGLRRRAAKLGPRLCHTLATLEPVTIAAVEGNCVGGGVALAVACDLIVAGDTARFLAPEIDRGMNMSWGAVPRLVNLLGPAWTKRFLIAAENWDAEKAFDRGLAHEVTIAGDALARARLIARGIAEKPPMAVRMIKRGVNAYASALAATAADMDGDQFALATFSDDFREGIVSFLERREPRFTGG